MSVDEEKLKNIFDQEEICMKFGYESPTRVNKNEWGFNNSRKVNFFFYQILRKI